MSQTGPDPDKQLAPPLAASGQPSQPTESRPAPRLSLVQILATVLAAVTSTLALSKLGAAGTVFGAALASLITVVGNYLYTRSLVRTHQAVRKIAQTATTTVIPAVTGRSQSDDTKVAPDADPESTEASVPSTLDDLSNESVETSDNDDPDLPDKWLVIRWNRLVKRFGLVPSAVAALVLVFGLIIAVVAITEAVSGKPLGQIGRKQPTYSGFLFERNRPAPSVPQSPSPSATDSRHEPTDPVATKGPGVGSPSPTPSKTKTTMLASPTGSVRPSESSGGTVVPVPSTKPPIAPPSTPPSVPPGSPGSTQTAGPTSTGTATATAPATSQTPSEPPSPKPTRTASATPTPSKTEPEPGQSDTPPQTENPQ